MRCAEEVGLRPDEADEAAWPDGSIAAFLELHIEQVACSSRMECRSASSMPSPGARASS